MKSIHITEFDRQEFIELIELAVGKHVENLRKELKQTRDSEFLTIQDGAKILNKSVATIYRMAHRKTIQIYKKPGEKASYLKRAEIEKMTAI